MDEFDQIEGEYFERIEARRAPAQAYPLAPVAAPPPVQPPPVPLYDISLAQAPEQPAESLFVRRVAGLPVWGWGLIGTAALGAGWYLFRQNKVESNPEPERRESPRPLATHSEAWSPSRSRFGDALKGWMVKRSIPLRDVTVYIDADDAKRHVKPVSPLVTMKCAASVKMPMAELQKFCEVEGLCATDHGDGVIGFYPAESGDKGREWESYIDALRDDGQTV